MYLTQYEMLQYIRHSFIEGDWLTSLKFMGVHSTHNSLIHPAIFASLEATDSTVHCLTLQYCCSFSQVHQDSKRSEADGFCRGHQYSPVYRWLVNENNS